MAEPVRNVYHGSHIRIREVAGLVLTEKIHSGGDRTRPHAHEQPFVRTVLDGLCQVSYAGQAVMCVPRTVVYYPPGETHWGCCGPDGMRAFVIEFGAGWRQRLGGLAHFLDEPRTSTEGLVSATALRIYDESRRDDDVSDLAVEGLALEFLASFSRVRQGRTLRMAPRWLRNVEDLLHAEFRTPPGLGALAQRIGVHPVHLSRVFRGRHGCSVGEYVRRIRIEHACRALTTSTRSLAEIAYESGFTDQSHFTKAFRRITLTTPAQYRAGVTSGSLPPIEFFRDN